MVSPIPWWPLSLKLIVSAMTLVLLVAYLRGGIERRVVASERAPSLDLEIPIDGSRGHA
jgi:hypothetical protein